jgi:cell division protease FtsH
LLSRIVTELESLDAAPLRQVDAVLRKQLARAMTILDRHRDACLRLVNELVERGELPGIEVLDALDENGERGNPAARDYGYKPAATIDRCR